MKAHLIFLSIFFITSCGVLDVEEQDSTNNNGSELQGPSSVPDSNGEVLNFLHGNGKKEWVAEGFTIFGMNGLLPCRLDDKIIIAMDGTYIYNGGSTLCGAEDNLRVKSGTWKLSDDRKSITFTESGNSHVATLIGITSDQISLSSTYQGLEVKGKYTSN